MLALRGCLHRTALVTGGRTTGWLRQRVLEVRAVEGEAVIPGVSLAPEAALKGHHLCRAGWGEAGACSGTARVPLCPAHLTSLAPRAAAWLWWGRRPAALSPLGFLRNTGLC